MWDLRMKKKIITFSGHVNEYNNCKSVVDDLELFIAAGNLAYHMK